LSKLPIDMLAGFGKLVLIAAVGLVAMKMIRAPGADKDAADAEATALAGPDGEVADQLAAGADVPRLPGADVSVAHVDGDVKVASLQRVGDAVGASPPEAAAVIRQWMNA
jgi:flagellar M-ring protein FliF